MRNPSWARSPWLLLSNAVLISVFAMNVYRAATQCITIDEAFSYLSFISTPFREILRRYDANNHVLNTLLAKLSTAVFGVSEFTLRIPSLAGGALFLFTCQRFLFRVFPQSWLAFLTYCAMILNPMVLDYLSAARGYSLALGFQFCALWLLEIDAKGVRSAIIGACLGLSVASNLTFLIPNTLIVGIWFALSRREQPGVFKRTAQISTAFVLTSAVILALPLRHANSRNFYVGYSSGAQSLAVILNRSFAFPDFLFGDKSAEILTRVAPVLLVASSLVALIAVVAGRRSTLLAPLVFVGSVASLIALHVLVGLLYPHERTGLYLIPFATITLAVPVQIFIENRKARTIGLACAGAVCVFMAATVFQYLIELRVNRYEEWAFDAGTKRVLLKLRDIRRGQSQPEHLGVSWLFDQTVNWYRVVYHWDWLEPVSRADPHQISFDSYYLTRDDFDVIRLKGLNVVYTDPVSGSVLALPVNQ
ncbi:MAG TPA: hypothetical protein VEV37_03890 [Bryobacteraceae bacterium]|nr:hypothetical protein [Bryobacteraceae bacterium]